MVMHDNSYTKAITQIRKQYLPVQTSYGMFRLAQSVELLASWFWFGCSQGILVNSSR